MADILAWSEFRGSIDAGLRTAISTTVRVTVTDPDGGHRSWFLGNERPAWLNITPGDYHLIRDGDRIRLTELSGSGDDEVPRILGDGSRTIFFTGTGPVDATAGPRFINSPLGVLLEKENLATLLDTLFPSGPVTRGHHDSRDAWIVPGGDGRTLVVDCSTGVVLELTGPTGTASLRDLVFLTSPVDDTEFTWTGTAEPPPRISDLFPTSHGESSDGEDPVALDAEFSGRLRDMAVPEGAATPSAPANPVPPHLLTYSRSAWRYEDDGGPGHRLGDTAEVRLRFIEGDEPPLPALLSEVTAFAEPASGVVRRDRESGSTGLGYRWPTRLLGHGWNANWDAPRPVTGFLRLRGWFFDDDACGGHEPPAVRGRVDRLTLVSPRDAGEPDTVDVDRISLPFPYLATRDRDYQRGISEVLVTLNLDHGAPPEVTDGIRMTQSGDCVAGDGFLWLPDAELPVVWRHDIRTHSTSPVLLPLTVPTTAHRLAAVYVDGGDCCLRYGWRTDRYDDPDSGQPDGTFRLRITPEGSVSPIDRDSDPERELLLTPEEHDTVSVQLSTDLTAADIESPHKAVRHPDGGWYTSQWVWLSPGRQPGPTGVLQLGRLHPDGSFTVLRREFSRGVRIDPDLVVCGRSVVRWNRTTLTRLSPGLEVLQRVHSMTVIDNVSNAGRYLAVVVNTPTRGDDRFGDSILDRAIATTGHPGETAEQGPEPGSGRTSRMVVLVDPETLEPLVSLTRTDRWPPAAVVAPPPEATPVGADPESGGGETYFLVDDDLVEINRSADGLWNARVIAGFRGVSAF